MSYWDACRFANWLHNDQKTTAQMPNVTEVGAYTLNGYIGQDGRTISRNGGARWCIPSEDEWYKAAYHKNDGPTGNYYKYPTASNTAPSNVLGNPTDPGNNATYYTLSLTIGSPYYRTEVGAHENSDSAYGTFDQGGNVWEWNEGVLDVDVDIYGLAYALRGVRGGAFYDSFLASSERSYAYRPSDGFYSLGFRVASVPEPGSFALLATGAIGLLAFAWRRRRAST